MRSARRIAFQKATYSHSSLIRSDLNRISLTFIIEVSSVEESDHTSTLQIFHLFYRLTLGDSWALTLDPQSKQNYSPLKLFVFTAICKKCFIAGQTTNTNMLPLSTLKLVYSMNWKESALWKSCYLLWGSDCVPAACSWLSLGWLD